MTVTAATVLGRRVPSDGFGWLVAQRTRSEADAVSRSLQGTLAAEWNRLGLGSLADHVEALLQEDQLLFALYLVSTAYGDSDRFHPGPAQKRFLSSVGAMGSKPSSASELLAEFVACATEDALELARDHQRSLHAELDQAPGRLKTQVALAEQLREAAQVSDAQGEENGRLVAENKGLRDENQSLGGIVDTQSDAIERQKREIELRDRQLKKADDKLKRAETRDQRKITAATDRAERYAEALRRANNALAENGLERIQADEEES